MLPSPVFCGGVIEEMLVMESSFRCENLGMETYWVGS